MDLTIEAIENDLLLAEQHIGRPGYDLHLTRAKVRATLIPKIETEATSSPIAIGPEDVDVRVLKSPFGAVYVVPKAAVFEDRFTIASQVVATSGDQIDAWMIKKSATQQDRLKLASELLAINEITLADAIMHIPFQNSESGFAVEPDEDDIFADAKRERRK